ncbi:YraN family protein [Paracoccus aerodenitrificans]|nr:YraN family protein [Paracoccus aerodenitrificans]WBU65666.1 YraN family protein [Paracoccus aerodenitrificans]
MRSLRGRTAYNSGALAEASVCDRYCHEGYEVLEKRWRGKAGEIDLIFQKDGIVVFVEVKSARDFASAAERISRRQMDRICRAACEFCATLPDGQMTNMRMDAAMVDRFGRIEVIQNAFGWQ